MQQPVRIAPSILAADHARLGEELRAVTGRGRRLHPHRRDGRALRPQHFAGTRGRPGAAAAQPAPLRCPPDDLAGRSLLSPPSLRPAPTSSPSIPRPARTCTVPSRSSASSGARAGVALNPATDVSAVEPVIDDVDLLLVMSVNPGFGGQSFIAGQLAKVRALRARIDAAGRDIDLEIDGGITVDTAAAARGGGRRRAGRRHRRLQRRVRGLR